MSCRGRVCEGSWRREARVGFRESSSSARGDMIGTRGHLSVKVAVE